MCEIRLKFQRFFFRSASILETLVRINSSIRFQEAAPTSSSHLPTSCRGLRHRKEQSSKSIFHRPPCVKGAD